MEKQHLNLNISRHTNDQKSVAEINIYGAIGTNPFSNEEDNDKQNVKDQLDSLRELDVDQIIVNVSSMGGIVDDAIVIYDLLRDNPASVTTRISGYTASAGTIIAMAGDTVQMSENALFLIHRARTMAVGSVNDMETTIKSLKKTDARIQNIYANKGGKPESFYAEWMGKENGNGVWLDADEVKDTLGLIDAVDRKKYRKVARVTPDQISNLGLPAIPEGKSETEKSALKVKIEAEIPQNIKDALTRIENAKKTLKEIQKAEEISKQEKTNSQAKAKRSRELLIVRNK